MPTLTRSEQLLAEKTVCVLLLNGVSAEGMPIYAYIGVRADRLEEFLQAQMRPGFDLESYAVILASGTGEPSEAVQEMMQREYGFNHAEKIMLSAEESKAN